MTHLVAAIDGSERALHAVLARALTIVGTADAVTLVYVREVVSPIADAGGIEGPVLTEAEATHIEDSERTAAQDALAAAANGLAAGVSVTTRVEFGDAATRICAVADEVGADVVVVGSHGRGAVKRALLGSVSTAIVHHSHVPVLVVAERS